ncbi:TlpA family protein disulfide reductase [Paludisphaera mucosa]|uniref:TlpA disulfide reductase family protein n=1 Tax=Paludisphaera mucosa TaxID=3030827 RepID=A0ABT6F6B4_9BACT|nr:TlpA disulfide reductase family protein [Paludisphaera mucosa]MDG3003138.1 TlpA disulfide reductase family protein [Paludisphaera mucosa]
MKPSLASTMRVVVAMFVVMVASPAVVRAEDRPADAILKDLDAIAKPTFDREKAKDRAAVLEYSTALRKFASDRSRLILELFQGHPDHPRLASLMLERWRSPYLMIENKPEDLMKEADHVLAGGADGDLKAGAMYLKVVASMGLHRGDPKAVEPLVEDFLRTAPTDPRGPTLLYAIARTMGDASHKRVIEDRILKDFPTSNSAGSIRGLRKQQEAVGKPFELKFADAVTGSDVSIAGLKGKVVVLDFWATWCGPCVAELPRMKELYAKYHEKGVEFIGVSLDRSEADGGLKALKEFVAKNEISWPQYYQGNYWQSEFSSSWGIHSIPSLFVVDKEGKLASVEARGKLDELIPQLLAKGDAPTH